MIRRIPAGIVCGVASWGIGGVISRAVCGIPSWIIGRCKRWTLCWIASWNRDGT